MREHSITKIRELLESVKKKRRIKKRIKRLRRSNENRVLAILRRARELGVPFGGGQCGEIAIALRDVVFNGNGQLFAVANKALLNRGHFVGHVGVMLNNVLWDAEGLYYKDGLEDFRAWGMVDPEDPDYWGNTPATDEEAEETVYLKPTDAELKRYLPRCASMSNLFKRALVIVK